MDEILRRLGIVETDVVDLKIQVGAIAANVSHLATANSVSDLRTEVTKSGSDLRGELAKSASDLRGEIAKSASDLRAEIAKSGSELRGEIAKSASDLRAEIAKSAFDLRTEFTASISEFRAEVATSISELRSQYSDLKSEGADHKAQISAILAILPHLATAASVAALETRIIKWFVGTAITLTTVAFSIAKFVH